MLPPCSRSWLWQYPCWHRVCPAARWFCFPTRPEPIRFSVRYGCWVPPSSPKQNRNQRGTAPYFSLESVSLHPLWRPTDYTHCLNRSVSAGFRRLPVSCLSCYSVSFCFVIQPGFTSGSLSWPRKRNTWKRRFRCRKNITPNWRRRSKRSALCATISVTISPSCLFS